MRNLSFFQLLMRIFFLISILVKTNLVQAEPSYYYKANEVIGTIWTRSPHDTRWLKIKVGQHLLEEELIQVTKDASITLQQHVVSEKKNNKRGRTLLRLSRPIIARISNEMLREIRITSYSFPDKKEVPPTKSIIDDFKLHITDAWERLAISFGVRPPVGGENLLKKLAEDGMSMGSFTKRLEIIAPVTNSILGAFTWPTDLKIIWRHPPSEHLTYYVYLWPAKSPRRAPSGKTDQDFFTIQIPEEGVYMVQVTSEDGSWSSPGHVIYANAPAVLSNKKTNNKTLQQKIDKIQARYPPDQTTFFVLEATKKKIDFVWETEEFFEPTTFLLTILTLDGKLVYKERTNKTQVSLDLPPGRYQWYVANEKNHSTSKHRLLTLLHENLDLGNIGKSVFFKKALESKKNTKFVFEKEL